MTTKTRSLIGVSAAGMLLLAAPPLLTPLSSPARAQAAGMAGMGETETISVRATVKTVDMSTRTVTLAGPQGETIALKTGDQVQNLAQVKPGNTVIARYQASVAYVLAPPGTKLPDDSLTVAAGRATPGQMPAGAVGGKLVITGLVVALNPGAHTIQLVDPSGGAIRTIDVRTQEGQQNMKMVKVGDTITAVISEAVAVAVEPTT
jgi:hypothetical protein